MKHAHLFLHISFIGLIQSIPTQKPLYSTSLEPFKVDHHHQELSSSGPVDFDANAEYAFSGVTTFHRLPHTKCLLEDGPSDDVLIVGVPFDTATSYRSGTRFGPNAIRQGSRAVGLAGAFSFRQGLNPYKSWATVTDCGDFPVTPFDNAMAFAQIEEWYKRLLRKPVKTPDFGVVSEKTGRTHPRIIALGGDHSISLPILRALHSTYGPVSVIHIDAHIDTWAPEVFAGAKGAPTEQSKYSDGTPYYHAAREGLLSDTNVHAGIRSLLDSEADLLTDAKSHFTIIPAWDIFAQGPKGIVESIHALIPPNSTVYLSFDVDSLDPAFAPGTAGPASGGWTPREVIQIILDSLPSYQIVGVDVVEVLPGMDSAGEVTAVTAAEITFEILASVVKSGIKS